MRHLLTAARWSAIIAGAIFFSALAVLALGMGQHP
jgi:hypothetical protein